jgi:hypothetical protein
MLMMKDGRRADHRVPGEVEFFQQVEDVRLPMVLRASRVEKDRLELAQLPCNLCHLVGAEAARVRKDAQAVAAIGRRSEHIDEVELHRNDATPVRRADLIDFSQGLIRFSLPSSYVKEVRATFDAGVFFKRVIPSGTVRAIREFQQPGFRPRSALARSGHKGIDRCFAPRHCRYWLVGQDLSYPGAMMGLCLRPHHLAPFWCPLVSVLMCCSTSWRS